MKKIALCLLTLMMLPYFCAVRVQAQSASNPLEYLEKSYPQLTSLFKDELSKYPAHYIFAIDVSGTMKQYSDVVTTSMRPFINALPNGDRVDVIPFGTEALLGLMSYGGIIDPSIKTALMQNMGNLYFDASFPQGFQSYTDVEKAVNAIAKSIQNNRDYKVNVIVILTDFRNDVKGDSPSEHKFNQQALERMNQEICAATNDIYTRSIALELPVDHTKPGYCLQQLKNDVFPQEGCGLEIVPLTNPGQMIGQWFEQLKRDIMVTKLRAVIENANKVNPVRLTVKTSIDGDVMAEIHWTPSKLYPTMQIDSSYVGQENFVFINNKEVFTQTRDSVIGVDPELVLGKIKSGSYGLHHFSDSLHLGINLPTEYDNELTSLGVRKPIPTTTRAEDRWIWTFFIPFWWTVFFIVLLIIYIIGIFKAIGKNAAYKLSGKVTVKINGDNEPLYGFPTSIAPCTDVEIGATGSSKKLKIDGANWNLRISKVNGNIFLSYFCKPSFKWEGTKGCVQDGTKSTSGTLYHGSILAVRGGRNYKELEHSVKMQIM